MESGPLRAIHYLTMSAPPSVNPYAPPQSLEPVQIDFRQAAVEESLRILEANPGRGMDDLGVSLVLPADVEGPAKVRHIGHMTLVRLLLGIGGLAIGAGLAAMEGNLRVHWGIDEGLTLTAAGCCSLAGMALLFASIPLVRRGVRRGLGERYEAAEKASNLRPAICVGVEDARTFTTMKIAPEDFAYVAFDAANRRLILEGLVYRYVIYAKDLYSVTQAAGATTTGTQIVFRVGRAIVGITLQFDSVWSELKKLGSRGQDPLLAPIQATFAGG